MKQYDKNKQNSLRKQATKIQNLIFYLVLLLLPAQFGKHFWPNFSFVDGARIDYLSPTVYATDILIILIFILSVAKFQVLSFKFQINYKSLKSKFLIIIFTTCIFTGIIFSKSPGAGFYGLLKVLEFSFFGYFTAKRINLKKEWSKIVYVFSLGLFFESLLTMAQYLKQGSIGGLLYFLGERTFNGSTPGIANTSLNGMLILRPYATFSHPNVLAAYLLIGMTAIVFALKYKVSNVKKWFFTLTVIIGTLALFLTMSRVAIILWVLIALFRLWPCLKNLRFRILFLIIVCSSFLLSPLGYRFTHVGLEDESVVVRVELARTSFKMFLGHPLFGVGLNNFFINTPYVFQPVHNIFLLVLSETGIIGLFLFIWFIIKTYKRISPIRQIQQARCGQTQGKNYEFLPNFLFLILSSVLILGFFDHYFLTVQQGQLMFSFVFGLCWSKFK